MGTRTDVHVPALLRVQDRRGDVVRRLAGQVLGDLADQLGLQGLVPVLAQLAQAPADARKRVGLVALERIPVRDHTPLQDLEGNVIGEVTSGLLGPTVDKPIAIAYVPANLATIGTRVNAIVRGKAVPMEVAPTPFTPNR